MVAAACLLAATIAQSDTPLVPPHDYEISIGSTRVTADVARATTTIQPADRAAYTVPVWARLFVLSPDASSVLVITDALNILGDRNPDQIVATAYDHDGTTLFVRAFPLRLLMSPQDMPQTSSGYVWLEGYRAAEAGWALDLSDGTTRTIPYR